MALRAFALLCAIAVYGQSQQASSGTAAPPVAAGLETAWEIAPVLQEMSAHAGRLVAALERVDARAWVNKGASETYVDQLQSAKEQARALADGAKALSQSPEKLSEGLVVLFRVQGLDSMLASLVEGMRRYDAADAAQKLAALAAEGGANRDRFQKYLVNLAADQDQRFQVMDKEAQRCRAQLAAPAPHTGKKK